MRKKWKFIVPLALLALMTIGFAHAQVADTALPTVPTGVSASFVPPAQLNVSWTASADNVGVVGYYVFRNGSFVTAAAGTSITDTVSPGSYSYTVAAYDAAGNVSAQSKPSAFVPVVADTTPPSAPTWISVTASTSSVVLSWNPSTDNVGVAGYYIFRNGLKIPMATTGAFTGTTYTDTGLLPGNTFTYTVEVYDASGNIASASSTTVTTMSDLTPPTTPYLMSAVPRSSLEVDLVWQPSTDNVGVTGYYVYRNGSQVANVSSSQTSYADTGLTANTQYSYTVAAYDAAGNVSSQSILIQTTTFAPDNTPPSKPHYLQAKAVSSGEIDLSWQPSTDNVGVAGYYVYRDGSQIADTTSTIYADTGLATSTAYTYAVAAYDTTGNTSASSTAVATTLNTTVVAPVPVAPATSLPSVSAAATPTATQAPAAVSSVTTASPTAVAFTNTLFIGFRSDEVKNLQTLLIQEGYLASEYATGLFGSLTQKAVQQFQCDQGIVCSGSSETTGWGMVGAKTRKALNALLGNTATPATTGGGTGTSADASANSSAAAATTLQQLEAQLQALQAQLKALQGSQ